jgi:hypothetical protein
MSGSTTPTTFAYTGKTDTYTVPYTSLYDIAALGAQGGDAPGGAVGGKGASISGDVVLTQGEVLQIAVGGRDSQGASDLFSGVFGNGGGSFDGGTDKVRVSDENSGHHAMLSFNPQGLASGPGSAFAVLHGMGPGVTLDTLINDHALAIT